MYVRMLPSIWQLKTNKEKKGTMENTKKEQNDIKQNLIIRIIS